MDLAEIPTSALLDELARRHDLFFCFGLRQRLGLEDAEEVNHRAHGDPTRLLGMIEREKAVILREMLEDSQDAKDHS
jgi:hypothetical protein